MSSVKRIAVLGLYNSGSTAVAQMLHRLGVNMGAPFWECSDEGSPNNFYEPNDLSWHLRRWWDEPKAVERVPAPERIRFLRSWAALQECVQPGPLGAKHPLLSLCGDDLLAAWGPQTRFLWCWRPLDQSIAQLLKRRWFKGFAESLQRRLWRSLNDFQSRRCDVVRLDWGRVKAEPLWAARELASLAGLVPEEARLQAAARIIKV